MRLFERVRRWARGLKRDAFVLYLAMGDPRTPWYAKALAFFVVAHTFSPIDLIPDFIPVLGYLDDLLITPLGLWLALRMTPDEALEEARRQADANPQRVEALGRVGAIVVIAVWLLALGAGVMAVLR